VVLHTAYVAYATSPRAELLHVLMLPDFERADRIGEFWGYPESRAFATADRLRGGPGPSSGARRDAAGGRLIETAPHGEPAV
jgi:hypothetical protein